MKRRKFLGGLTGGVTLATVGSQSAAAAPSRSRKTIRAGTAEETTVHTYDSGVAGPTMVVIGGVHGDESAGYLAADEIATWSVSAGRLIVIPRANVPAIRNNTRDGLTGDLNRQFPLLQQPTSTLARVLWNEVMLAGPDLFVDLHEARTLYTAGGLAQTLAYYPVQNVGDMAGRAIEAVNRIIPNSAYRFHR